jgi:hypothetical protein
MSKKIARSDRFCHSEQKFLAKTVENMFLRRKGVVILGTENRYQRKHADNVRHFSDAPTLPRRAQ